jgi:hypothetical protein
MGKLIDLIIFIIVVGLLWWALNMILTALLVPDPWRTIAIVVFVVLAVFAAIDYFRSGTWWFRR